MQGDAPDNFSGGADRGAALGVSLLLAVMATGLSLSISAMAGWQQGDAPASQTVLAALGVIAVLGAHLLPGQCRVGSLALRLIGAPVWLACLTYAAYGHLSFLLDAQRQAGDRREAAVEHQVASAVHGALTPPQRSVSVVLDEVASVKPKWRQAQLALAACRSHCDALQVRELAWQAKVAALDAEATEARRWEAARDLSESRRDGLHELARADPVTVRVAALLGVTAEVAGAVTLLPVAVILDGVGCLCWLLVLEGRWTAAKQRAVAIRSRAVKKVITTSVARPVTSKSRSRPGVTDGHSVVADDATDGQGPVMARAPGHARRAVTRTAPEAPVTSGLLKARELAASVWPLIAGAEVKATVTGIREHLHIGQALAREVRLIVIDWQREAHGNRPPEAPIA